ncbi:hypothetical protein [Paenibacillus glacialis]|uniref:Uncharacterized protein n=1 Tax=Paenibacillus glacialis TaxID=494026 RepID=A0A168LR79_9BACL|nr:hypothetical protein [Paenibacillus glacialis]OAB43740.1 hypothetical protein PGLA_08130 [Paenibacillus glacialis]
MNNNDSFRQSHLDLPAKGPWVVKYETIRNATVARGRTISRANRMSARKFEGGALFIGPSVEGSDKEYVKVLSGNVNDHKPSFA